MAKTNDKRKSTQEEKQSSEYKISDKENWLDEHGYPSSDFLQAIADRGGQGAIEKLRSIAEDLDAEYSPDDSPQELIDVINSATQDDPTS